VEGERGGRRAGSGGASGGVRRHRRAFRRAQDKPSGVSGLQRKSSLAPFSSISFLGKQLALLLLEFFLTKDTLLL